MSDDEVQISLRNLQDLGIPLTLNGISAFRLDSDLTNSAIVLTFINALGIPHYMAVDPSAWEEFLQLLSREGSHCFEAVRTLDLEAQIDKELKSIIDPDIPL